VDKFVGDAIMAIWGVPFSTEWDTHLAVRACLAMREELSRLNELRISRGQVPLKIGMGLNRGPLIAGNIGSEEKMEFTVIGDTVNTASRLESMTKAYGTDLLISSRILDEIRDEFIVEECEAGKVKGKSEALQVFKVKGYYEAKTKKPILIETAYSSYAAEKSDKVEAAPKKAAA
jgi:adenylate cyclase